METDAVEEAVGCDIWHAIRIVRGYPADGPGNDDALERIVGQSVIIILGFVKHWKSP